MTAEQYEKASKRETRFGIIALIVLVLMFYSFIFLFIFEPFGKKKTRWKPANDTSQIKALYIVDAKTEFDYEIIKEIPIDKKNELVDELSNKLEYYKSSSKSDNVSGISFVIVYDDDSYDILPSKHPCYCLIKDGEKSRSIVYYIILNNNQEYERLIVKYLVD